MAGFWKRLFAGDVTPRDERSRAPSGRDRAELEYTPPPRAAAGDRDVVGEGYMAVRGESFKRANLDRLMDHRKKGRVVFPVAVLRPQPHPKHRNAVAVIVDGAEIGYLSREVADEFALAFKAGELACAAEIRREHASRDWNVVLRVDYQKLRALIAAERVAIRVEAMRPTLDAVSRASTEYAEAKAARLDDADQLLAARDAAICRARQAANPRPTLKEVAASAGLSANTISRITKDAAGA